MRQPPLLHGAKLTSSCNRTLISLSLSLTFLSSSDISAWRSMTFLVLHFHSLIRKNWRTSTAPDNCWFRRSILCQEWEKDKQEVSGCERHVVFGVRGRFTKRGLYFLQNQIFWTDVFHIKSRFGRLKILGSEKNDQQNQPFGNWQLRIAASQLSNVIIIGNARRHLHRVTSDIIGNILTLRN